MNRDYVVFWYDGNDNRADVVQVDSDDESHRLASALDDELKELHPDADTCDIHGAVRVDAIKAPLVMLGVADGPQFGYVDIPRRLGGRPTIKFAT